MPLDAVRPTNEYLNIPILHAAVLKHSICCAGNDISTIDWVCANAKSAYAFYMPYDNVNDHAIGTF